MHEVEILCMREKYMHEVEILTSCIIQGQFPPHSLYVCVCVFIHIYVHIYTWDLHKTILMILIIIVIVRWERGETNSALKFLQKQKRKAEECISRKWKNKESKREKWCFRILQFPGAWESCEGKLGDRCGQWWLIFQTSNWNKLTDNSFLMWICLLENSDKHRL